MLTSVINEFVKELAFFAMWVIFVARYCKYGGIGDTENLTASEQKNT